jgi:HAD superfamily hydrolase (TIGR01458 family)
MAKSSPIPILIDFDGVINIYGNPAPYAQEFLSFLHQFKIPSFILSNSTLKNGREIKQFLIKNKLPSETPIMTAADAAVKYVENHYQRVAVYCADKVKKEFEKYIDTKNPQAIVVGDLGDKWSIELINEIFLKVFSGADLIAMHMNKYWEPHQNKFILDAGSFIAAIEYATSKKAVLIGKPSPIFFQTVLEILGYKKDFPFIMIGDDIESDLIPVNKMGGKSILILTGKTKSLPEGEFKPDHIANDLAEVIGILKKDYLM